MPTMMNRFFLLFWINLAASASYAQPSTEILFTIGEEAVTVDEFRYIYEKNNSLNKNEQLYSEESLREYLDLYVKFKLKVVEAKSRGMDTTEKFLKEYGSYRNQLAQPYLNDKSVTEELIKEAYERMHTILRASHILIDVAPDAFPSDTLEKYKLAMEAKKRVDAGEDFAAVAKAYSQYTKDPTLEKTGGDIGYFSVFNTVYPFEDAAYNTEVGGVVGPIRTRFGYHIIKVTERKPYKGEMKAAHIMIGLPEEDRGDVEKAAIAKARIDSIYQRLHNGESFSSLARKYSEHYTSGQNGGELRPFNYLSTNYPREFIDAVYALEKDGAYTKPFLSDYGWHIAKRLEIKPIPDFEQMQYSISKKVERDSRSQLSQEAALEKIKRANRVEEFPENLDYFRKLFEKEAQKEALLKGEWQADGDAALDKKVLIINKDVHTQSDFAKWLIVRQMPDKFANVSFALDYYYERYVTEAVLGYENAHLEEKYPEFRNIAKEYREGILLFEISDQEIWSKAVKDSAGLHQFYENNIDSYMWKKRCDAIILYCKDKETAKSIKKRLNKDYSNLDTLFREINGANSMSFSYSDDVFEKGDKELLDDIWWWRKGWHRVGEYDGRYVLVRMKDVMKPEPKPLNRIKGVVIADYQDELEKEWVAELRKEHPVKINETVLESLFQ